MTVQETVKSDHDDTRRASDMQIQFAFMADAANVTPDGKLNVLGIFSNLNAHHAPCWHPRMALVFKFVASPDEKGTEFTLKINLIDPEGKSILAPGDMTGFITDDPRELSPELPIVVNLDNISFQQFGPHRFDVLINSSKLGEIPLMVRQIVL